MRWLKPVLLLSLIVMAVKSIGRPPAVGLILFSGRQGEAVNTVTGVRFQPKEFNRSYETPAPRPETAMTSATSPPWHTGLFKGSVRILRHAALGTASAILFGAALGALIGAVSLDPLGWVLGGAGFGAVGGPVFGVVEALVIPAGTGRTGWLRCMAVYGGVGGVVFGGVALVALGSAAPDRIIPELGELLGWGVFGAVTGVVFGGIVGASHALSAVREARVGRPGSKQTHRMKEV